MAFDTTAPPHTRYNAALAELKSWAGLTEYMADAAYAVAAMEHSPGPKRSLLDIAAKASAFAAAVKAAKALD